jgi:hypothetical protein
MGVMDGLNYYVQSSQFSTLLSNLDVKPGVYLAIAVLGFLVFLAHGRDNA